MARVRDRYMISEEEIRFDPQEEDAILRHLIRGFTSEPGVRDLERVLRTLFLRTHRKEILGGGKRSVCLTRKKIREYLDRPPALRDGDAYDRVGEIVATGVGIIDVQS